MPRYVTGDEQIDTEIAILEREYATAIADTEADQGEEVVEAGGWAEIARAIVAIHPEVSQRARDEFLRMQGIPRD